MTRYRVIEIRWVNGQALERVMSLHSDMEGAVQACSRLTERRMRLWGDTKVLYRAESTWR